MDINLKIKKVNNEWKVVDESYATQVKAKTGDKVTWTAEGTDAYFQFIEGKLVAKEKDKEKASKKGEAESLAEIYTTNKVAAGESVSFVIRASAAKGKYPYAVFCTADSVFATGDSPPKIIIE